MAAPPDTARLAAAGLNPSLLTNATRSVDPRLQGSTWLRWTLCEAAQIVKRSPEFAPSYAAISHRRGKKIATTAIARKLRAHHLFAEQQAGTAQQDGTTRSTNTAGASRP